MTKWHPCILFYFISRIMYQGLCVQCQCQTSMYYFYFDLLYHWPNSCVSSNRIFHYHSDIIFTLLLSSAFSLLYYAILFWLCLTWLCDIYIIVLGHSLFCVSCKYQVAHVKVWLAINMYLYDLFYPLFIQSSLYNTDVGQNARFHYLKVTFSTRNCGALMGLSSSERCRSGYYL